MKSNVIKQFFEDAMTRPADYVSQKTLTAEDIKRAIDICSNLKGENNMDKRIKIESYNPYRSLKDMERALLSTDASGHFVFDANGTAVKWVHDEPKLDDKGIEEWVWVTGYKGTDKDMKCRDYQYEMGKQHDMPEGSDIAICYSGFHFCDKPKDVFRYYGVERGNRFFEVKALVRRWNKNGNYTIEHSHDKMAAKSILFVRELTTEEIFEHLKHELTTDWTLEQKNAARLSSIGEYYDILRTEELVKLGYSEAFASWTVHRGGYEMATIMGNTPGVSMDVKVMTICMNIRY